MRLFDDRAANLAGDQESNMQISIIVVVDAAATLEQTFLEENAYILDNTRVFSAFHDEAGEKTTHVCGVCNADGSQAEEAVLNWLVTGVSSVPPTLPRNFPDLQITSPVPPPSETTTLALPMKTSYPRDASIYGHGSPVLHPAGGPILNPMGWVVIDPGKAPTGEDGETSAKDEGGGKTEAPRALQKKSIKLQSAKRFMAVAPSTNGPTGGVGKALTLHTSQDEHISHNDISSYVPPQISSIYGPAVDNGVMFPALYGSPEAKTEGWYWSASVDVSKIGTHLYYMDVVLLEAQSNSCGDGEWVPRTFTLTGKLAVSRVIKRNGFATPAGYGSLPLRPTQ